jgi:hemolysin activation/secretion protein
MYLRRGRLFGRAFDPDTLVGDRCVEELGELRYDLSIPGNPLTQTELYAFADHGDLTRIDPAASTPGHSAASSAGAACGSPGRTRSAPMFKSPRHLTIPQTTAGAGFSC